MLDSVKIQRRQSEIRQSLAELVGKDSPTEDETRSMDALDKEYRTNETRYRAALVAEDSERREAKGELEERGGKAWAELVAGFELRQVALALDEGRPLDGHTAEVVSELRSTGGYRGVPIPLEALEQRAGETVASGTPNPIATKPIIDRLFPSSVTAGMGGQLIQIDSGAAEWPVVTSSVTAGWAATETGAVAGPTTYTTTDKALAPNSTLGIQLKVTRKSLKQSGDALEAAIRRDMSGAMQVALDKAAFLGSGSGGEPLGLIPGVSAYGITAAAIDEPATWGAFRWAVTGFMNSNAATGPGAIKALIRPELWAFLDGELVVGTATSEWDRLLKNIPAGNILTTTNALAAPTGSPVACTALLATSAGGVPPFFLGLWGGIDLIRDPYSDAASGGLRLTGLLTADITVARGAQTEILTGLELA